MADNVAITAGSGTTVATDQIPGTLEHIQVVKIADGTADSATRIPGGASGLKVDLTSTGANATAIKTDGSATTQPVSAASLPLPTGASTAAKQPALGTAGTASADVITVQGIAAMTALKVDGSAVTQPVSGTVTVQDGGGAVSVDDNGGSLTVDGTVTAAGAAADDAAISGNPVPIGAKAASGPRTAVTAGDVVYPMANLQGALITHANLRENLVQQHTTITSSTAETTIVTADATYALDLYGLIITNTSSTYSKVTIKDSTAGTTRMVISVPAQETRGFMLPSDAGHKQSAANNNWTATCGTSVADIDIAAFVVKRT